MLMFDFLVERISHFSKWPSEQVDSSVMWLHTQNLDDTYYMNHCSSFSNVSILTVANFCRKSVLCVVLLEGVYLI